MRFVYYANPNPNSDDSEGHITRALKELGHEVGDEGDILLFHKKRPKDFSGFKVCWYFDKIWNDRVDYIKDTLKWADMVCVTDETWVKENPHPKLRVLRQGIGNPQQGERFDASAKIAFTGQVYPGRWDFVLPLAKRYGKSFQIFTNTFNKDLNDLCASVPIFVAPTYPSDDYYWSNRVYLITGSGGFLLHPRLKGLEAEYEDKKEIVFFDSQDDLMEKIDYYLANDKEREAIRLAGWEKTKTCYTYKTRTKQLCTLVCTQLKNNSETH